MSKISVYPLNREFPACEIGLDKHYFMSKFVVHGIY